MVRGDNAKAEGRKGRSRPGAKSDGRKGGGPVPREVIVSKKLSWLLRHGAEREGLHLGEGGYVGLKDVVSLLLAVAALSSQKLSYQL